MLIARVALDVPLYRLFDYLVAEDDLAENGLLQPGRRVRVPFGRSEKIGIVVGTACHSELPSEQLKWVQEILEEPPLPPDFLRLCAFVSDYYHVPPGEALLQALPPGLKKIRRVSRREVRVGQRKGSPDPVPPLTGEQSEVLAAVSLNRGYVPFLLHGVTGSGKTEIYLRLIEAVLALGRQALLLVPEINLTPQLEDRIRNRFPEAAMVMLHSDLAEAARERAWRAASSGAARIVVGTRLAVFVPLPEPGLIVVDEEHDSSYKQQDGIRYSARDLAVFRARDLNVPIILGSATPSLESWARAAQGRYRLLNLRQRATGASLPLIRLVASKGLRFEDGLSATLLEALARRLEAGEQSLIFLNRRGYAPVLVCTACGWVPRCGRCAANLVVHLRDQRLRCHHCGFEVRLPRACPTCGNQDIHPFGQGTQRLEAALAARFPDARVLRVDRDAVKSKKQWEALLARIHAGEADILVGTQMLTKGHDFPRLTLVGVINADAALFSADFRASERLFSQLMQVSGRAGRADLPGEVLIQTEYPEHPLYRALLRHDYPGYAETLLEERRQSGFPPYAFQAVLGAEAPDMEDALGFLKTACALLPPEDDPEVTRYDPVPMRLARLKNLERAQLLVESPARQALQSFLARWREALETVKTPARLRWRLEVDPLEF